jgi:hypothetical protein
MTQALPPGKRRFVTRYRVVVSVILAGAAAALYVSFTSSVDHKSETANARFVTLVKPAPNEVALRQDRIVATLLDGYTGVLIVDQREIPEDQTDRREGLNVVAFTPGPGTETGILQPGRRCATVVYWNVRTASRANGSQSYQWCWNVH